MKASLKRCDSVLSYMSIRSRWGLGGLQVDYRLRGLNPGPIGWQSTPKLNGTAAFATTIDQLSFTTGTKWSLFKLTDLVSLSICLEVVMVTTI